MDRNFNGTTTYIFFNRRGSREPCGSKCIETPIFLLVKGSRLARALWIEIGASFSFFVSIRRRGSREPCGSKLSRGVLIMLLV